MLLPFSGRGYTLGTSSQRSTSQALTPSQLAAARAASRTRQALWKQLVTKILVMLDHLFQRDALRAWFGAANYRWMFEDDFFPAIPSPQQQYRFIDNEFVGQRLDCLFPSLSRGLVPPPYCTHPTPFMHRRGHPDRTRRVAHVKGIRREPWIPGVDISPGMEPPPPEPDYSWMCGLCAARWQRHPATNIRPRGAAVDPPGHNDLIPFGRYAGDAFMEVLILDPDYCQWVVRATEVGDSSPAMNRFALYIKANQHQRDIARGILG